MRFVSCPHPIGQSRTCGQKNSLVLLSSINSFRTDKLLNLQSPTDWDRSKVRLFPEALSAEFQETVVGIFVSVSAVVDQLSMRGMKKCVAFESVHGIVGGADDAERF